MPHASSIGDLYGLLASGVAVDVIAGLYAVDRVTERPGGTIPHGTDDLVHPPAAWSRERVRVGVEDVLTGASVIEDRDLLTDIGVTLILDPVVILGVGEPDASMAAITQRLAPRLAAAAQRHLREDAQPFA